MDQRMIALEEKIAHLEHHLGQLDGVVRELFQRHEALGRRLDAVQHLVASRSPASTSPGADPSQSGDDEAVSDETLRGQKPPHW